MNIFLTAFSHDWLNLFMTVFISHLDVQPAYIISSSRPADMHLCGALRSAASKQLLTDYESWWGDAFSDFYSLAGHFIR